MVWLPSLDDVRRGDSVLKAGGVNGLRAQDVDCSLQSDGGVVDRPLEGPGGRGGDPHSLGVDVADATIQIVAVVAYDQDFEKRRGEIDPEQE